MFKVEVNRTSAKKGTELIMDSNYMKKILKSKNVKISEMPDDLDIESLPEDIEIILDEDFEELDDDFWED